MSPMSPVKVLEVVCEGDDVMDGHLGLHDVDLLLAGGRQQVDLLHSRPLEVATSPEFSDAILSRAS